MIMTEDENGRIRATEEEALLALPVVEFFLKLQVFRERMDLRAAALKKQKVR